MFQIKVDILAWACLNANFLEVYLGYQMGLMELIARMIVSGIRILVFFSPSYEGFKYLLSLCFIPSQSDNKTIS